MQIRSFHGTEDLGEETNKTIARIEAHHSVAGILFIRNNLAQICTVPETMAQTVVTRLPILNYAIYRAVTEIDIFDRLIAYRIETENNEILVAPGREFTACVIHSIKKNKKKK